MEEGFYPRRNSLAIERGANFHPLEAVNEANETCSGCDLTFRWEGPVSDTPGDALDPNVLYRYGSWRYFIRDCISEDLIMEGFAINDDEYKKYDPTILERIRFGFTSKNACNAFFSKYIGRSFSVNSSDK